MGRQDYETETLIAHTLRGDGFDASEDGTGRGTPIIPILEAGARTGTSTTDQRAGIGIGEVGDPMFTLQSGKQHAIAFSCKDNGRDATNDLAPTLRSMNSAAGRKNGGGQLAIAMSLRGREGGATAELSGDVMPSIRASQGGGDKPHILMPSAVRRLTPRECERLQGMPDHYTRIPWRKKPATDCPDGPRYKAIGNSMAVPCVGWILARLDHVHRIVWP
jgi:DNA (cytosine-5)-methyltransferase 1